MRLSKLEYEWSFLEHRVKDAVCLPLVQLSAVSPPHSHSLRFAGTSASLPICQIPGEEVHKMAELVYQTMLLERADPVHYLLTFVLPALCHGLVLQEPVHLPKLADI